MDTTKQFELSIETDAGAYTHGFHLGTEEPLARTIAEEIWRYRRPKLGQVIKTVALKRDGKIIQNGVFNGEWS